MAKCHLQLDYAILRMFLQLWWKYLEITVPRAGTLMGAIGEALIETLFPAFIGVGK